jgi:hypothetical protein
VIPCFKCSPLVLPPPTAAPLPREPLRVIIHPSTDRPTVACSRPFAWHVHPSSTTPSRLCVCSCPCSFFCQLASTATHTRSFFFDNTTTASYRIRTGDALASRQRSPCPPLSAASGWPSIGDSLGPKHQLGRPPLNSIFTATTQYALA